jgi:CIC family chloride channel protein
MILLAALAASFFARRFTPKSEWKLWIACGAAAGWPAPIMPLSRKPVYCRDSVWHADAGLTRPVVIAAVVALLTTRVLAPGASTL